MTTSQDEIFGPFLAMQILTILVWFYMYAKRIPFLLGYVEKHKRDGLQMEDIGNPTSRHFITTITPEDVRNPSDNLKNLFEVPILFYAMTFYLYATQSVDTTHVRAAWAFVGFRYLHSAIHCTFNKIETRFQMYALSSLSLFFMVVRASITYFMPS